MRLVETARHGRVRAEPSGAARPPAGGVPLPQPTRCRRVLLVAAVAVVAGITAVATGTTTARPPTAPTILPPGAFRPVHLSPIVRDAGPGRREPAGATIPGDVPSPPVARKPGTPPAASPVPPAPAAPASPAPPAAARPPGGPVHTVQAGDTLWQIASWHRADLAEILRWNPRVNPQRLVTGQRILVPGGSKMPKPRPAVAPAAVRPPRTARIATRSTPSRRDHDIWPLPLRGTITTRFSAGHPGIDIAAPAGTAVRAIAAGTVLWAGWKNNGGGNVVVLRHADGMVTTYNHNQRVLVRRGEQVSAGQRIALVGATGIATGPHLDFRIEMESRLVDPLALY
ncbi:MAG: peptidoglycan DD-metalloendopeptidase family protein [Chloroflexi bacterium]|nr:peptidoglycan DD-metalloendopeptidase family protein [Chloroflexota bacterium]